jgi:hypothetical protein
VAGIDTALVVGVTSHRDLVEADLPRLRDEVMVALGWLRGRFPQLRLQMLSPLAEGGDQLVAEAALDAGADLLVPLPMPVELYLEHAAPGDREAFVRLASRGRVVELAPPPEGVEGLRAPGPVRDRQYLAAGLYVAGHCHVLLALWDGYADGGVGGTAQIVRYHLGGPVPGTRRARDGLRPLLAGGDEGLVLHVPVRRKALPGRNPRGDGMRWVANSGIRPFDAGMPPGYRRIFERMQAFERDRQCQLVRMPGADAAPDPIEAQLHVVDAMAVRHRRLAAAAVRGIHALVVLVGLAFLLFRDFGAPGRMLWVFPVFLGGGLWLAAIARRREWHRKHVDYRALAEGLRVQAFWRRAGLSVAGDARFAHDDFLQKQDVESGWIRNVMRQAGLLERPPAADDDAALPAVIADWIGEPDGNGQLGYYARQARARERRHRRTRTFALGCVWSAIGIGLLLAALPGEIEGRLRDGMVTAMGFLSLVAAVLEAYSWRKADQELVRRYRFMHRIYGNAHRALDEATSAREQRGILCALGEAALEEHAEWALMQRRT